MYPEDDGVEGGRVMDKIFRVIYEVLALACLSLAIYSSVQREAQWMGLFLSWAIWCKVCKVDLRKGASNGQGKGRISDGARRS